MNNAISMIEDTRISKALRALGDQEEEYKKDEALVAQAMQGDEIAFGKLVENYREKIYRVLFFMVHHQEDAMDLLQETFIKAYQSLHKLRSPCAFYSWLSRIAINLAINAAKKKQRLRKQHEKFMQETCSNVENPMEILEKQELRDKLTALIASLPAKQKAALILCDIEGYSYKEIADILKCRMGTVMSRIYYAREYIRKSLSE